MAIRHVLLAATLLGGLSGAALAQSGPVYDPGQLPEIKGKVAAFLLTPRGDVDGMMLADGTEVHVAPRLSTELVFAVKPGDSVTIHGLRAKAVAMVMAASVTNDATGVTVAGGPHANMGQLEATGTVKAALHTPRGDVDGVVLQDGTIVHLPPPEAQTFASLLAPGRTLYARGFGSTSPLGKVLAAQAIGADKDHVQTVAQARPMGPDGMHGPMHGPDGMHGHHPMRDGHDPMMGAHGTDGAGAPPAPQ